MSLTHYQTLTGKKFVKSGLRKLALSWLALISLITVSIGVDVPISAAEFTDSTPGNEQVIVQLNSKVDVATINSNYGTSTVRHLPGNETYLLAAPAGESADALVAQLQRDSRLIYAEANYKTSLTETSQIFIYQDQNSTLPNGSSSSQALTQANNQWAFSRIQLAAAQQLSRGAGINIALIDSGVDLEHPDLKTHLVSGYNILQNSTNVSDSNGHGTFVAGILAQVAPDAKILPVVVVGSSGYGTVADAAQGLYYAADHGATVINFSLGLYTPSKLLLSAVQYAQSKGAVIVASVGNQNSSQLRYPAAYAQVIGVAGTDQQDKKATFSNYGSDTRLSAPGVSLYSTYWKGGYSTGDGTSFSTPLVTGEAALVWALHSSWTGNQIANQLDQSTTSLVQADPTYGARLGRGLINIYQACLSR